MPIKIRELKALLTKAGFSSRPGKGSHTIWYHPNLPEAQITLSGQNGDDADKYQIKQVRKILWKPGGK